MATTKWFGTPFKNLMDGTIAQIDWNTDTIKCSLHTSTYTPNQDSDDFFNDATNELSGGGYVTKTLANPTITYDSASDEIRLDADDLSWSSLTAADIRWATIWKDTAGASSTDPLIAYIDFGAVQSITSGTFSITFDSTGVLKADAT